ncbi:MAG: IS701 family transposase [Deltaproteobacteria bacterium]|nr:IS701 family transposase [Deltaproteobacteria bacterium]
MKKASPASVAGLATYLVPFASHFKRSEGRRSLERHLTGLLADIDYKSGEQIARTVAGTNSQRLQALLTELQWDENAVNAQRVRQLMRGATSGEGVLICGETEMSKQGTASVGVARQYAGTLGKVANCQVAVSWQYADARFSWPVNLRLYLPENWTQDAARCQHAHVPPEMQTFATKPEIALTLLDEADRWGVPYHTITADCTYASDPTFLAGLESRGKLYVVPVPREFGVQASRRRAQAVEGAAAVLTRLPERAWRTISWRQGNLGRVRRRWIRMRCWRATAEGRGAYGWLIGERPVRGQDEEWKYYFSNAGPRVKFQHLIKIALQRSHIGRFYQQAKQELGWDHYEGRLWLGFHRHALLVCMAYSFLVLLRARQRGIHRYSYGH